MPLILWDASALVKHYGTETGSQAVDAIFQAIPTRQMITTMWGYAECFAILHRKRNSGLITAGAFTQSAADLEKEVLDSPDFGVLSIEDDRVLAGLDLVTRHSLNTSDAAILATSLRYGRSLLPGSPPCILVAADRRLLLAASAEGLAVLNPETLSPAEVASFLAASR